MERREFLGSLTGPVAAVCAVCMGACSKSAGSSSSTSGSTNTPPTANFTVDIVSQLPTVGSSVAVSGVLIVRVASGNAVSSFVAVQQACTHEGTNINYVPANQIFLCPNHGAQFNTAGKNIGGQATSALKVYTLAITGSTLTVTG